MRKLPHTAGEDLLKIIMRRYERASTLLEPPRRGLGKLLGDTAAVAAFLDRLLHHAHVPYLRPPELADPPQGRKERPMTLSGQRPSASRIDDHGSVHIQ